MIEVDKVRLLPVEDGNSIVITQVITLSEDDAIKYIKLDELARSNSDDTDVTDLLSDYGWSYCDDVLSTMNWLTLSEVLEQAELLVLDI